VQCKILTQFGNGVPAGLILNYGNGKSRLISGRSARALQNPRSSLSIVAVHNDGIKVLIHD
jgi:hypothetical protein